MTAKNSHQGLTSGSDAERRIGFRSRVAGRLTQVASFSARWVPLIVLLAAAAFLVWLGLSLDLSALGPEGLGAAMNVNSRMTAAFGIVGRTHT